MMAAVSVKVVRICEIFLQDNGEIIDRPPPIKIDHNLIRYILASRRAQHKNGILQVNFG